MGPRQPAKHDASRRLDDLLDSLDRCGRAIARDPRLGRVREILETQLAFPIPLLGEAADAAALEYTSFSRHFHRSVGVTFSEWLTMRRVARAAELLRDTDLAVAVIAQRIGFARGSSLGKAFRRWFGESPREYRRRCRGGGD
jgi:transcriptional regulator GlxA family with amidase domain